MKFLNNDYSSLDNFYNRCAIEGDEVVESFEASLQALEFTISLLSVNRGMIHIKIHLVSGKNPRENVEKSMGLRKYGKCIFMESTYNGNGEHDDLSKTITVCAYFDKNTNTFFIYLVDYFKYQSIDKTTDIRKNILSFDGIMN